MTIVIQIKAGARYTLWNVTEVRIEQHQVTVKHSDRPDSIVQGHIASCVRKDS